MTKFLIFMFNAHRPYGGWEDIQAVFEGGENEAIQHAKDLAPYGSFSQVQIINLDTLKGIHAGSGDWKFDDIHAEVPVTKSKNN